MPKPSAKDLRAHLRREQNKEYHLWKVSLLRGFVSENGWKALRKDTIVPPGERLYGWVRNRRIDYKKGVIPNWLASQCESIPGWSWDHRRDATKKNIDNLRAFVKKNAWSELGWKHEVDGVALGQWAAIRRVWYHRGQLEEWIARALEAIPGWSWEPRQEAFDAKLAALKKYVARHGSADFNMTTTGANGELIGRWAGHARELYREEALEAWIVDELEALPGWLWEPRQARQQAKLELLREFVRRYEWDALRAHTIFREERLGSWAYRRRQSYRSGELEPWLRRGVERIPGWRKWARQGAP